MDIRVIRAHLRLTQNHLGKILGLDQRRVSEIESGDRELTEIERRRIADLVQAAESRPATTLNRKESRDEE